MPLTSKRNSLIILAVTALACSKAVFLPFDDPDGNLLVTLGLAAAIYVPSVLVFRLVSSGGHAKKIFAAIVLQIVVAMGFFTFAEYGGRKVAPEALPIAADPQNAAYLIEGEPVSLQNGIARTSAAAGSASQVVTRYFGNEVRADLDNDGHEDAAFILVQERGGSGTFYYAVAARATAQGYVGSDGYLLGDRIAPQSTGLSQNPRHKNVVVFNYADRAPGEPFTAAPTIGKSAYLKLDPATMRWGIVMPDFEGEAR